MTGWYCSYNLTVQHDGSNNRPPETGVETSKMFLWSPLLCNWRVFFWIYPTPLFLLREFLSPQEGTYKMRKNIKYPSSAWFSWCSDQIWWMLSNLLSLQIAQYSSNYLQENEFFVTLFCYFHLKINEFNRKTCADFMIQVLLTKGLLLSYCKAKCKSRSLTMFLRHKFTWISSLC